MRAALELAVLAAVAGTAFSTIAWILGRSRRTPWERERRRRALISTKGRLIEGVVTDFLDGIAYYSYGWRGVEYAAAQDLRWYASGLPDNPNLLIGPVSVRFLPGDPSTSIVLSETWSGFPRFRLPRQRTVS